MKIAPSSDVARVPRNGNGARHPLVMFPSPTNQCDWGGKKCQRNKIISECLARFTLLQCRCLSGVAPKGSTHLTYLARAF